MAETSLRVRARSWPGDCRRLVFVWLALMLALLTFESARHSVHHLTEGDAETCAIASTAEQVPAVGAPAVIADAIICPVGGIEVTATPPAPSPRLLDPDQERAPPPSLSA